jgi:cell division transport system ATP-binding protein
MRFTLERTTVEFNGIPALHNVSLELNTGGSILLIGPTGAGKTTLLRLLYADILPTGGQVLVDDVPTSELSIKGRQALRRRMGIVEQNGRLVSDYTVFDNVLMPFALHGLRKDEAEQSSLELLADLNISYIRNKLPRELSGGERHLVALARALALQPEVVLADEPAGALDKITAIEVARALKKAIAAGTTVIASTHNEHLAQEMDNARMIEIREGIVVADRAPTMPPTDILPPSRTAEI